MFDNFGKFSRVQFFHWMEEAALESETSDNRNSGSMVSSELQKNAEKFFGTESDENLISLCDYFVAALSPAAAELKLRLVAEGKETGWKSREE